MINYLVNIPSALWAVLIGLSVLSVALIEKQTLGFYGVGGIILISAIKSRLVILHYMEAKHAEPKWRFLYEIWNFTAAAIIIIGHYMTMAKVAS